VSLLEARGISIAFGGLRALDGVGFAVDPGEVLAIIGPNGAGKTTLFNIVTGLYRAQSGEVRLEGRDVMGLAPHELAARGLARTFQNLQIFFRMSALENVMVGRHLKERRRLWAELLGLPSVLRENRESRERARDLLAFVGLAERAEEPAAVLPYGALKRLEIARALACEPKVLMLDEPAAGCNPVETEEIDRLVVAIARKGVAVVLVEHDMKLVMRISDRVLVLDQGRVLAEGTPQQVRSDPRVIEAYLGRHGLEAAHAA
jgi:branched-chain amino acid transport system ATP-binding protein